MTICQYHLLWHPRHESLQIQIDIYVLNWKHVCFINFPIGGINGKVATDKQTYSKPAAKNRVTFSTQRSTKIHYPHCPSLWPSGIGSRLERNRLWVRFLVMSDIYLMFIEPTITWVHSGFSGCKWLDTRIVFKKCARIHTKIVKYVSWSDFHSI